MEGMISTDPEIIKQVWGLSPYTIWQMTCTHCGGTCRFDMSLQDVQEALIDEEWEFRGTGVWCPGCCEDQRRDAEESKEGGLTCSS